MARKGIDVKIPDKTTSWQPYTRGRVEEHLKERLNEADSEISKSFGYHRYSAQPNASGYYTEQFFRSQEDAVEYDSLDPDDADYDARVAELLLSESYLPIAERVETTTYLLSLSAQSKAQVVSIDGNVTLGVKFESSRKDPDAQPVENVVTGTLYIQSRANSSQAWTTRVTQPIVSDNSNYQMIDVSEYVAADVQDYQVRMYVSVDDDTVTGTTQSVTWTSITKTTLKLEYASDWSKALTGNTYNPEYKVWGTVAKTLNVKITNTLGQSYTGSVSVGSGEFITQSFSGFAFADLPSFKMLSLHGVHQIESWLSVTGEPEKQSPHIYNQVMVKADAADMTKYLMMQDVCSETQLSVQNYVESRMFGYAVYNPSGEDMPLAFLLTNYGGSNVYASYPANNPQSEMQYSFVNTVEIEDAVGNSITAALRPRWVEGVDAGVYPCLIDNSLNYTPKAGADFVLNPKLRSNAEANPATIINAANGQELAATFDGFTFADGIDGWTVDEDGRKCLRIPAGRKVVIPYDIWATHRTSGSAVSLSIEICFASRNVIDEDTPILKACNTAMDRGLVMMPLEGAMYSAGNTAHDQQSFAWREDTRTHMLVNILHDYQPMDDNSAVLPICRVAINSVWQRSFAFDATNTTEWYTAGQGQTIEIGQDNAGIDIYSLRIYANSANSKLSTADAERNYISSLPTAAEKNKERERNDIKQSGKITLDKVLEKGLNVWYYDGRIASKAGAASGGSTDTKNDHNSLYLWMHDDEGNLLPEHSGVITDVQHSNQGTTANSYAEHNQQDKARSTSVFTDLNGEEHDSYALTDGVNGAKKLVLKINFASSMQSHKAGATALYNDLYMLMCASDKAMFQGENNKNRVAVLQKPVYCFHKDQDTGEIKFLGIGTFGPGKMDKPTWGYTSEYPEFAMFEGSDNNRTLTDMRCPWDDSVVYDKANEAFYKAGIKSIGFNAGATDADGVPTGEGFTAMKNAWNYIYSVCPFISHYDGTSAQLKADANANTSMLYWVTQGADQYNLYRFNETSADANGTTSGEWVDAGLNGEPVSVAGYAAGLVDFQKITDAIINARVADFKSKIDAGQHFFKNDLLLKRSFDIFVASSDGQSKNTYYTIRRDLNGNVRICQDGDDLDTIMPIDNVSHINKPYWAEPRDKTADGTGYYWEGQYNSLWKLVDLAYGNQQDGTNELRDFMLAMLTHMGNLVTKPGLEHTAEGCLQQYFFDIQEYFAPTAYNETARVRYESNHALYLAGNANLSGSRGTLPLEQSIGDQLQNEKQFMSRRLAYLSSWCNYGIFGGAQTTSGAWIFPVSSNAQGAEIPVSITLTLTPHQWLYASGKSGTTVVRSDVRMRPGQQYNFTLLQGASIASDTEHMLNGIDYYRSVGNLGNMPIGTPSTTLNISGKRLVEFIAEPTVDAEDDAWIPQFRPQSVGFSSNFKMMRKVSLRNCTQTSGSLNLSGLGRLQELDVRGTQITSVQLPRTSTLETVHLPATTSAVEVNGQINLETLTLQNYANLTSFRLLGTHKIDSYTKVTEIYDAKPAHLATLKIDHVNWASCSRAILLWLANRDCELKGEITMATEGGSIGFSDKIKLGAAFGNIDSASNDLKVNYALNPMQASDLGIVAKGFMTSVGTYYPVKAGTATESVNNFKLKSNGEMDVTVSLPSSAANYAEIANGNSVHVLALQERDSETRYDLTVSLALMNGTTITASRKVAFCVRVPQLGDFAYADGSFDSYYSAAAKIVGVVYKVELDTSAAEETYIARVVSLKNGGDAQYPWGMSTTNWSSLKSEIDAAMSTSAWDVAGNPNQPNPTPTNPSTLKNDGVTLAGAATDFNGKAHTDAMYAVACQLMEQYIRQIDSTILMPTCVTAKDDSDVTIADTLTKLNALWDAKSQQMLYLPATYCALYEPDAEDLHSQYAKGNWYGAAMGELMLICYYWSRGLTASSYTGDDGEKTAIFARAASRAGLTQLVSFSGNYWSTSEFTSATAFNASSSSTANESKNTSRGVRPVAAFRFVV